MKKERESRQNESKLRYETQKDIQERNTSELQKKYFMFHMVLEFSASRLLFGLFNLLPH